MPPRPRPTSKPSFTLIHPTVWPPSTNVTDRQDRQRSDSTGRIVLQAVAQKIPVSLAAHHSRQLHGPFSTGFTSYAASITRPPGKQAATAAATSVLNKHRKRQVQRRVPVWSVSLHVVSDQLTSRHHAVTTRRVNRHSPHHFTTHSENSNAHCR